MVTKSASRVFRPRTHQTAYALFLLTIAIVGCRRADNRGEVTGRVTFKGQPVSEGMLIFSNPTTGVFITASLASDGSYRVGTAKGFGLPPGTYRVAIVPASIELPVGLTKDPPPIKECRQIPVRYRKAETSGLSVVVTPRGVRLDVDMKPR